MASSPAATSSSAAQRGLVEPGHLGDREAVLVAQRQQRRGVRIVVRESGRGELRLFAVAADEPSADRVVGLLRNDAALGIPRGERHRIRMSREARPRSENDVLLREGDVVAAVDPDHSAFAQVCPRRTHLGGVAGFRGEAAEAGDDGIRRAVADPGRPERAEQRASDTCDAGQKFGRAEPSGEVEGGAHRSDRMGARRPHSDGEQVEGRDVRSHPFRLRRIHPFRFTIINLISRDSGTHGPGRAPRAGCRSGRHPHRLRHREQRNFSVAAAEGIRQAPWKDRFD